MLSNLDRSRLAICDRSMRWARCLCVVLGVAFTAEVVSAAGHQLYLDFGPYSSFPEYSPRTELGIYTSPLVAFDATELDAFFFSGQRQEIIDRVAEIVEEDYWDFDLAVSTEVPPYGHYQHIGIDHTVASYYMPALDDWNYLFGMSDSIENDPDDNDFGRVWAGAFGAWDEAWQGTNSTVERWARTIGETAAHEAGHNYGLVHPDYYADPNHIMTTDMDITPEERATLDRYWKWNNYNHLMGVLGPRAPMSMSMSFPNDTTSRIRELHGRLHSRHDILDLEPISAGGGFGPLPFDTVKIIELGKDANYDDGSWYEYEVRWTGGAGVYSGQEGRLAAAFGQDADFVFDSVVPYDGQGNPVALNLPLVSCTTGALDANDSFSIPLTNHGQADLTIENFCLRAMPYMIDMASMNPQYQNEFLTTFGILIAASDEITAGEPVVLEAGKTVEFALGNYDAWMQQAIDSFDTGENMLEDDVFLNLPHGTILPEFWSIFPSAYLYLTFDVVLPDQMLWDAGAGKYIEGDLVTTMYVQTSGMPVELSIPDRLPGDANLDGTIDEDDAAVLAANWQTLTGATWAMGDFNDDGAVNDIDATLLAANWQSGSSVAVPEPGTLTLLAICGLTLLGLGAPRRKR